MMPWGSSTGWGEQVGAERRIAVDHVNIPTVGLGDDEAAVSGEGATDYRRLIWRVVLPRHRARGRGWCTVGREND